MLQNMDEWLEQGLDALRLDTAIYLERDFLAEVQDSTRFKVQGLELDSRFSQWGQGLGFSNPFTITQSDLLGKSNKE